MSFTKTAHLPVSPDEAYALITQPERLRRWQAVSAVVDLRAGGGYRWTITPGHVAAGTFTEVEPGKRIVFGWGWDGDDALPPDASTVTVTVEPAEGGS
ncbi:MAG: SRPBCC domain-containing protein, partial [Actinomycetota bacterium]|nr:SRPBCC domain-containing protein [Actinomycetota bacterium]